jgi:hypothetical protein
LSLIGWKQIATNTADYGNACQSSIKFKEKLSFNEQLDNQNPVSASFSVRAIQYNEEVVQ